jgi:hypothetical protein
MIIDLLIQQLIIFVAVLKKIWLSQVRVRGSPTSLGSTRATLMVATSRKNDGTLRTLLFTRGLRGS